MNTANDNDTTPNEFEKLVVTVTEAAKDFVDSHNVDPLIMAQALLKVGLQIVGWNTQHPAQAAILEGVLADVSMMVKTIHQVERMNSGDSGRLN